MSVEEEFELFCDNYDGPDAPEVTRWQLAKAAYLAGRADERKACVEIAKKLASEYLTCGNSSYYACKNVINAIERQEGK